MAGHEAFAMIFGNLLQPLKECQRDYNGFLSGINDRRFAGQPLAEDRISCRRSVDRCLNLNDLRGYLNRRVGVRDLVEKGFNLNGFGEIHRLSRTLVLVGSCEVAWVSLSNVIGVAHEDILEQGASESRKYLSGRPQWRLNVHMWREAIHIWHRQKGGCSLKSGGHERISVQDINM
jgi:hypothetical protein